MNSYIHTNKLLKDNIIDRQQLLLKKGNYLNLNNDEIVFLLEIIPILVDDKINEKEILKKLTIRKRILDNTISKLIENKYVKSSFKKSENQVNFDFSFLWIKLFNYYQAPNENAPFEEKLQWFLNVYDFESEKYVEEKLKFWIEEQDWNHIVDLTNKIKQSNLEKISWNTFANIHDKLFEKSTLNDKKAVREILKFNWLED